MLVNHSFWWKGHMDEKAKGLVWCPVEANDGAEVCELVGTYILSLTSEKYNKKDFRLYCDDGLVVVKNKKWAGNRKNKEKRKRYLKKIC